jgi:hypothetical protein
LVNGIGEFYFANNKTLIGTSSTLFLKPSYLSEIPGDNSSSIDHFPGNASILNGLDESVLPKPQKWWFNQTSFPF